MGRVWNAGVSWKRPYRDIGDTGDAAGPPEQPLTAQQG